MDNLSRNVKISSAITPTAGVAGVTDINGATLQMSGYDGVLMVVRFGAITAGAVTGIRAQQGALSDLSDAADLLGTAQVVADTDDDGTFYIDLFRPRELYVRLSVDRATQNAVVASAEYYQYNAAQAPVVHGANVAGEFHASPIEGTA